MDIITTKDMTHESEVIGVDDFAMFLNLMYPETVDDILEYITIYTDTELIQEIINTLHLNYTCVVETTQEGLIPVGYIRGNAS